MKGFPKAEAVSAALEVGTPAPDFTVQSTHGEIVLGHLLENGPVILAYYPADFTPGWTIEVKAFQNDIARFEKYNAQVLGVSKDSLETHQAFAKELGLSFPLVVDDGSISKHYGSGRITHIIDVQGIVHYIHKGMPDNETLLEELNKMHVR